ncbi:MAG: di-heme oxidoredictase family protein [Pontibacterium sp.]
MKIFIQTLFIQTIGFASLFFTAATFALNTDPTTDFSRAESGEVYQGGLGTHFKRINADAFSQPSANLSFEHQLDFRVGNGIFKKLWVSAPATTTASDGLGPLYNARACQRCHLKDGRGHPPEANWPEDNAVSMFLRLSIPAQNLTQQQQLASGQLGNIPEPTYGGQLQDFAVAGLPAEGRMSIRYQEIPVILSGGETASLRQPVYSISDLSYGPLHPQVQISPRVAPPMIGLGLLEQISDQDLLAAEDPDDKNNDGISGRANRVWHAAKQQISLGRFGWKAGNPSLNQQNNSALNGDMGISNPDATSPNGDCTPQQPECLILPNGNSLHHNGFEASRQMTDLMLFYTRNLAVPARRDVDKKQVLAGKQVFYNTGCQSCHKPKFVINNDPAAPDNNSPQLIWPYTDLLLHDMGEGLADNRPEFAATGQEWRTPPLWGIGLTQTVSGHSYFLHDGRARNLLEAILWHGGEAESIKQAVIQMPKNSRDNLIQFLESL